MRIIEALPLANSAPMVDRTARDHAVGTALQIAGLLFSVTILVLIVSALIGVVPTKAIPPLVALVAVGPGIISLGNLLRRR